MADDDDEIDVEQLVLGDLLNHVLDKGVVISGTVTISIANIDLLVVDLRLLLTSVETSLRHGIDQTMQSAGCDHGDGMSTHLYCLLPGETHEPALLAIRRWRPTRPETSRTCVSARRKARFRSSAGFPVALAGCRRRRPSCHG